LLSQRDKHLFGGLSGNASAGRNAVQFNVAEQDNFTRRMVALRTLGGGQPSVCAFYLKFSSSKAFQNSSSKAIQSVRCVTLDFKEHTRRSYQTTPRWLRQSGRS
jgi:hypothetical protein